MKSFWRRRILMIIGMAFLVCFFVALPNYIVDPFWCFQHSILFGRYQTMFDERQQKTNYLAFREVDFDTVILGNSRVTYMDPRNVPGRAFNYAVSSMQLYEYLPYLQFVADSYKHNNTGDGFYPNELKQASLLRLARKIHF